MSNEQILDSTPMEELIRLLVKSKGAQILDSIPTADIIKTLVKREYVDSLLTSDRIRVIMFPELIER